MAFSIIEIRWNTQQNKYKTVAIHVVSIQKEVSADIEGVIKNVEKTTSSSGATDYLWTWIGMQNTKNPEKIYVSGILQREGDTNHAPSIIEAHREFVWKNNKWDEFRSSFREL